MIRKIIKIDEEKCNGCGACADACHEGAIGIVNGKAHLLSESFCDGFGDCLPECPTGAITFEEREAPDYDASAVAAAKASRTGGVRAASALGNWPCQLKLAPPAAAYYRGAPLLIAADCTAYAYANIHGDFMRGRVTLIGCPKLDGVDYTAKLTEIMRINDVADVTVLRMGVPCCGGLERAVREAAARSGKNLNVDVRIVSTDGKLR